MEHDFSHLPFRPADILLPQNCDLSLWSVVACDQYTSQPEYWQRVEERVGRAPPPCGSSCRRAVWTVLTWRQTSWM